MATWKKISVSGSNISQFSNDSGYLTSVTPQHAFTTASFNGTNLLADSSQGQLNFTSGSGGQAGILITATAGTDTLDFSLGTASVPNAALINDSITVGTTEIDLGNSSTTLAGLTSVTSTDFTGNLTGTSTLADGVTATTQTTGDNSTKVATTAYVDAVATAADLDLVGDGSTTTAVDLDSQTLTFIGQDGLELSASAQTITATIADDSIANGKLANDGITIAGQDISLGGSITADTIAGQISATTITNGQLVNDGITIGDQDTSLGGSVLNNLTHSATGSFTGSFVGDGSGLTATGGSIISGDAADNQVAVFNSSNTIDGYAQFTFNDATNLLTVTGDQLITGDLTVQGTASFQNTTELQVADRFILMASGSNTAGDGGIVIQQGTQNIGEVFGFDSSTTRFGLTGSFDASATAFIPDAFMAAIINTAGNDPNGANAPDSRYQKKGNLYVASNSEDIWIYS
jgi:hypothetical protein